MAKFPVTARTGFTKMSGAAPAASVNLHPEDSRFLIAAKEAVAPTALVNTVAPAVTGTATVGSTLTCTQGTWTGANGVYTYEWQHEHGNGSGNWEWIPNLNGGTTFVLTSAQLSKRVRCVVRGINGAGPVRAASNIVGPIA